MKTNQQPRIRIEDLSPLEALTPEEMERIFGAGRGSRVYLGVEALEGRELMAASLTASLNGGVLRIEGTEGRDVVHVMQNASQIQVEGIQIQTPSGPVNEVAASALQQIEVHALGGNDDVRLDWGAQEIAIRILLFGGAGDDALLGGVGNNTLSGGDGSDSLYGQRGNEYLDGGTGDDYLDGREGDDVLHGREGNDRLAGSAGAGTIEGGAGSDALDGGGGDDTLLAPVVWDGDRRGDGQGGYDVVELIAGQAKYVETTDGERVWTMQRGEVAVQGNAQHMAAFAVGHPDYVQAWLRDGNYERLDPMSQQRLVSSRTRDWLSCTFKVKKTGLGGKGYAYGQVALLDENNTLYKTPVTQKYVGADAVSGKNEEDTTEDHRVPFDMLFKAYKGVVMTKADDANRLPNSIEAFTETLQKIDKDPKRCQSNRGGRRYRHCSRRLSARPRGEN